MNTADALAAPSDAAASAAFALPDLVQFSVLDTSAFIQLIASKAAATLDAL